MAQPKFIDNTKQGCWGYQPEPTKHDAFVGWRTILESDWKTGKQRLDYVPGRGSSRGLETDCNRLVRWWSKGRNAPEKQFLKDRTTTVSSFREDCKKGVMTAYAQRSGDYAYISLYLDYPKKGQNMTIEEIRIGQRFKCKNKDLVKGFGIGTVMMLCDDGDVGLRNEKGDQIVAHLDDLIPEDEWKKSTRKKKDEKQEYTVSMRVDGRVDVTVEATSFEEAFELAQSEQWDPAEVECVEFVPVNATDSSGEMRDYN